MRNSGGILMNYIFLWGFSHRGHHCLGPLPDFFFLWGFSDTFPIKNLGSKVTTATTAPLQAMPPEVLQKEWKNISMGWKRQPRRTCLLHGSFQRRLWVYKIIRMKEVVEHMQNCFLKSVILYLNAYYTLGSTKEIFFTVSSTSPTKGRMWFTFALAILLTTVISSKTSLQCTILTYLFESCMIYPVFNFPFAMKKTRFFKMKLCEFADLLDLTLWFLTAYQLSPVTVEKPLRTP